MALPTDRTSLVLVPSSARSSGKDGRTTLMMQNIPNQISEQQLVELIGATHAGTFDFLHLPMDSRHGKNAGYAFINFTSCQWVLAFWERWHGHEWRLDGFQSTKTCAVTYARQQRPRACISSHSSLGIHYDSVIHGAQIDFVRDLS